MKSIPLMLVVIACLACSFVFAEEGCGYTQLEMNACAAKGKESADAELNRLYKLQMSYLQSPDKKEQLKKAQLAWLKYRDAVCEYEVTSQGGSMYPMALSSCIENQTKKRNAELSGYVACRDNGCPE
jgi:uncharacterized protein YecT (DUF1311 family)